MTIKTAAQFAAVIEEIGNVNRLIADAHDDFEFDHNVGEMVFRPRSFFVERYTPVLHNLKAMACEYADAHNM